MERGRELGREEGSWGEGLEEVHEKERAGLRGVDMWTKAFDPTLALSLAIKLEI